MGKHFICGRRYYNNSGTDTFKVISERYTRSGARYITILSDIHGATFERKIRATMEGEFIDPLGGAIKFDNALSDHIIRAVNETEYIALNDKEQRFMEGEEVYVSFDELKRWLNKLPLGSHNGFKIQRDPHEVEAVIKRPLVSED